jgi:hypothetical protein
LFSEALNDFNRHFPVVEEQRRFVNIAERALLVRLALVTGNAGLLAGWRGLRDTPLKVIS